MEIYIVDMSCICGIDEAGRGPLAGPVTAAAVVLPEDFPVEILNDSKKLSEKKRISACRIIIDKSSAYGIGWGWPGEIDRLNIHNATLLAMKRAYEELGITPEITYIDGLFTPDIDCRREAVVKGDSKIHQIMAASILAKTVRDLWMTRYSWIETEYSFEKHKGYPTKLHRSLVENLGLSPIHRKSFRVSSSCNLQLFEAAP